MDIIFQSAVEERDNGVHYCNHSLYKFNPTTGSLKEYEPYVFFSTHEH